MRALAKLCEQFYRWMREERRYSPHTLSAYTQDLESFIHFCQDYRGEPLTPCNLTSLSPNDVRAWLADRLQRGLSAPSNARALSTLKTFLRFLQKHKGSDHSPLLRLRSPRLKHALPRPLTETQADELLETVAKFYDDPWLGLRDLALFSLLYGCGLRISEALSLKAHALQDMLKITGKGKKDRLVPVLPIVQARVNDYLQACPYPPSPERPLFVGARGAALQPAIAQKALRHVRRLLGLPETCTPHALRHSFATSLLANKVDLRTLQMLMGHESLVTTQRYTAISDPHLTSIYSQAHPRSSMKKG